jgi:hypothetical protein
MKRQNYILKIDNPCGQDWSSMTQSDNGKFCSHCSKTIIDFTNLSDTEVLKLIEQTTGKICGRLTNQQINRVIDINQPSTNSRLYKLLAGLLLVGVTEQTFATTRPTLHTEVFTVSDTEELTEKYLDKKEETLIDSLKNVVQGIVLDSETKEPLLYASITIKDTKTGVVTDIDGKFKFVIPDSLLTDNITLVITYIGYEKTEFTINRTKLPITKELLVIPAKSVLMGDVIIIKKKKWWQQNRK